MINYRIKKRFYIISLILFCSFGCKEKDIIIPNLVDDSKIEQEKNNVVYGSGSNYDFALGINIFGTFSEFVKIKDDVKHIFSKNDKIAIIKNDDSFWINKNDDSIRLINNFKWKKIADNVNKVSIGESHILYLDKKNQLWGLGSNLNGQLGIGNLNKNTIEPIFISGDVIDFSCGNNHTFFIKKDFSLWGSGNNEFGQLGVNNNFQTEFSFFKIKGEISKVFCGNNSSFIINTNGDLFSTGENSSWQLGDLYGLNKSTFDYVMPSIKKVAVGLNHTLILSENNELFIVGENDSGQLGEIIPENQYYEFIIRPRYYRSNIRDIEAGYWHSLILTNENKLLSSGRNNYGQLGDNTFYKKTGFVEVQKNVIEISAGANQTFILKQSTK